MVTKNDLMNVRREYGFMLLPLMSQQKNYLQHEIISVLNHDEFLSIRDSIYNENVLRKLVLLAKPLYEQDQSIINLYSLSMVIGCMLKDYEWGIQYIQPDGIYFIAEKIESSFHDIEDYE